MKTFFLLFTFFFASFATKLQDLESLQYFIKLVEENNLNVSIVIHQDGNHNNHKMDFSLAVTFPLNKLALNNPYLNAKHVRKFDKKVRSEGLAGQVVLNNNERTAGLSTTRAHEILTKIQLGTTGFFWNAQNFISQYTFVNEKSETTKIIFADLDIKVVTSTNFTEDEIEQAKQALTKAYFVYTPNDFPEALAAMLKVAIPGQKWQVVSRAGDNNYVNAQKILKMGLLGDNYLVFSV